MARRAKAPPKPKNPTPVSEPDSLTRVLWGFDGDGNIRTRGQLELEGQYSNLGSCREFERGTTIAPGVGIEYTLTSNLGKVFTFASHDFLPVLWPDGAPGEESNVAEGSTSAFDPRTYNKTCPRSVSKALDGRTQRGSEVVGEEIGETHSMRASVSVSVHVCTRVVSHCC